MRRFAPFVVTLQVLVCTLGAEETESHWAYLQPHRATLNVDGRNPRSRSPIDFFVQEKLRHRDLSMSPAARPARLLRRVYFDLIGLPPSVREVDTFLKNDRPDAFERQIDRLLASPRYGEKWARAWLDLARYADSNGYQADQFRNVWPYRDWVIGAMNRDQPFNQFSIEQLAGDLLPNATVQQNIATGFHRLTTCNVEAGVDPEENRVNQIVDRVNTTGTVWLGTSVACGQCHDHKYDPFSQQDYYRLFAFFNNTPLEVKGDGVTYDFYGPKLKLPLDADAAKKRDGLQTARKQLQRELEAATQRSLSMQRKWEQDTLSAKPQLQAHVLPIKSFHSQGGASHTLLADGSVLLGGKKPKNDLYTVVAPVTLRNVTGFKLETMTHASLPGMGPGRHHSERPNFVLHEFSVRASRKGQSSRSDLIAFQSARADYAQPKYPVAGAIDGKRQTGWAIHPQFGKPHQATFFTRSSHDFVEATTLTFTLDQHHGQGRTIGRLRLSAVTGTPGVAAHPMAIRKLLRIEPRRRTEKQRQKLTTYYLGTQAAITDLRARIASRQEQLAKIKQDTTLVMIEQEKMRQTNVFRRGDFLARGEQVAPGTPTSLHPMPQDAPSNRLGLARWLFERANPLTPRVIVNRWWAEIFGRGLVATVEDFGTQGEPPTHPRLLDYLACEFRDGGWSRKRIHRRLVTSETYRQSSRVTPQLLEIDAQNLLLARGPRFRLPAELIRDNAMHISGVLTNRMGGPAIYPPQPDGVWRHVGRNAPQYQTSQGTHRFRRGVYVVWRRSAPYASFTNFDAPDRASCVVARARTNSPLQALTLLNDPAYIEMAWALAERIASEHTEFTIDQKVTYAVRLCVSRLPTRIELEHLEQVYRRELRQFQKEPAAAEQLVGKHRSGTHQVAELAAWFYVANILLNLDETITKG